MICRLPKPDLAGKPRLLIGREVRRQDMGKFVGETCILLALFVVLHTVW